MSDPIDIGLVGCGRWGRHILHDLQLLGCRIHVADRSETSRRAAIAAGAADAVRTAEELPAVVGAIVATPTIAHVDTIEALRPRDVPIYCEKPLTSNRRSAARLAAHVPRLFVMDKWRYHPGVEMLRDIARTGELGPVVGLQTTRIGSAGYTDVDGLWILAPHDLAVTLEILGGIPHACSAEAEYRDGVPAVLRAQLGSNPWVRLHVSTHGVRRREIRLEFRDGLAILRDAYDAHVEVVRGGMTERRPLMTELPLFRELRAFVNYLGGGAPPRSTAAEGALVVDRLADLRARAGLDSSPEGAGRWD